MGFDLGAIIGNLIMSYLASRRPRALRQASGASFEAWMLETIESVWTEFSSKFVELWRAEANGDAYPAALFAGQAGASAPRGRAAGLSWAGCSRTQLDFGPLNTDLPAASPVLLSYIDFEWIDVHAPSGRAPGVKPASCSRDDGGHAHLLHDWRR